MPAKSKLKASLPGAPRPKKSKKPSPSVHKKSELEALIEEATVDCNSDSEAASGMTMSVSDNVLCPFQAKVIGELVTVEALHEAEIGIGLKATCAYKRRKHEIDLTSLEFVEPYPKGFEYIEAYLHWLKTAGPGCQYSTG